MNMDPEKLARLAQLVGEDLSRRAGSHDLTPFERHIQQECRRHFLVFSLDEPMQRIFVGELIRLQLLSEARERRLKARRERKSRRREVVDIRTPEFGDDPLMRDFLADTA